jgi:hypothetical protein
MGLPLERKVHRAHERPSRGKSAETLRGCARMCEEMRGDARSWSGWLHRDKERGCAACRQAQSEKRRYVKRMAYPVSLSGLVWYAGNAMSVRVAVADADADAAPPLEPSSSHHDPASPPINAPRLSARSLYPTGDF